MIAKVFLRKIMRKYLFFRKFLEILCRTAANARDSWKNVYNCKKCILFPKVDFFAITKFRGISPKYITFRIFAKRRRHFRLTLVIGKRLNFVELVLTWARGVLLLPVPTVAVWSSRRADLRNVQLSVPLSSYTFCWLMGGHIILHLLISLLRKSANFMRCTSPQIRKFLYNPKFWKTVIKVVITQRFFHFVQILIRALYAIFADLR
jgi:hypothetical protein